MSTNFSSLLQVQSDSVERPKPLPAGTYSAVITEHKFGESSGKGTPYVEFMLRFVAPEGDVSPEDFATMGGQEALLKQKKSYSFYITADSLYRLNDFLRNQLKIESSGKTIEEMLLEVPGKEVKAVVAHVPSKRDPSMVSAVVDRLLGVD